MRRPEAVLETRKNALFLELISKSIINKIILSFFKDFTNHIEANSLVFSALDLSSTFLNTGIIGETFQQSGRQYSFIGKFS